MRVLTRGPEETVREGRRLGKLLRAGDTVCLHGELGAGKTTFVKGVASTLGLEQRDITSASFTIVAEYDTAPPFYHIDLYRLENRAELDSAGIYDYIGGEGITVIEWAERADPGALEDAITVRINFLAGDEREIIVEGVDKAAWKSLEHKK